MEKQLVVFELSNEFYGINIAMIESISFIWSNTTVTVTGSELHSPTKYNAPAPVNIET